MTGTAPVALSFTGPPERTCPCCGHEEATEWLLRNNHGAQRLGHKDICVAMYLTKNHVAYDARELAGARAHSANCGSRASKRAQKDLEQAEEQLQQSIAHAREVWPDTSWLHDVLASVGLEAAG